MPDYVIFFASNLPQEEYGKDERRNEVYSTGMQAIEQIEGAQIIMPMDTAAIALVHISNDSLNKFKKVLDNLDPPAAYKEETNERNFRTAG